MNQAMQIKKYLLDEIHNIASDPARCAKNPEKDFSRHRKLSAEDTLTFTLSMETDCTNRELLKYCDFAPSTPSLSAYFQQRDKLRPDVFQNILYQFNDHFETTLYMGKYVVQAVDGSGFNIFRNPDDPDSFYAGNGKSSRGYNELYVVASYSVIDKVYTDAVICGSRKKNEYAALCEMIDRSSTDKGIPLFLADRGFPSYNVFAHAEEKGVCYLIRANDRFLERLLGRSISDEELDLDVERILMRTTAEAYRSRPEEPKLYRHITSNTAFDFLEKGSHEEYSLNIRAIRVRLANGMYLNLVTNLPRDEFAPEVLQGLYRDRWEVETSYLELKHSIGAVDFHCRSLEHVMLETWARLVLYNFCSRITALAVVEQTDDKKHIYRVNYSMAFKNCRDFLRQKIAETTIDIVQLIRKYLLPVRPGRNFERKHRFQLPMKFVFRH